MEGDWTGVISQSVYHCKVLSSSNGNQRNYCLSTILCKQAGTSVLRKGSTEMSFIDKVWKSRVKTHPGNKHCQIIWFNLQADGWGWCFPSNDTRQVLPTQERQTNYPSTKLFFPPVRLKPCTHAHGYFFTNTFFRRPASKVKASSTVVTSATYPLLFRS